VRSLRRSWCKISAVSRCDMVLGEVGGLTNLR
jgi:hypothetical protein